MPLPEARPRDLLTRRTVTCEGHLRDDGLVDIEGHLVDARGYDTGNDWRGTVKRGEPAHEMWLRLTVDDQLTIREVACSTDAAPYPRCREVPPNLQRLVGVGIAGGFKKEVRARVGGTAGCTHILALIDSMANVAVQAVAGSKRHQGREALLDTYGTRGGEGGRGLVGTCHSYAPDSPIVAKLWPEAYTPRD